MAALKALVIAMALVIVAGMALMAWGLYEKAADPGFKPFPGGGEAAAPQASVRPFGRLGRGLGRQGLHRQEKTRLGGSAGDLP